MSALVIGVLAGSVLTRRHDHEFAFLVGAKPIAVRDGSVLTSNGVIKGITTYFSFEGDWQTVYRKAVAEMPGVIERETLVGGVPARVLTVPRMEDGRMRVFFPPVREITIMPQRLVLTEGGQLFSKEEEKNWAAVKISEYRQPHIFEDAVGWVREKLDI